MPKGKKKKRAFRIRGMSRKQHAFLREKLLGLNDKEAALAAGYSLSVSENTKQKLWAKPLMRESFEHLKDSFRAVLAASGMETNTRGE